MKRAKKKVVLGGPALKRAVGAILHAGLQIKHIEFRLDGTFVVIPRQRAERDDVIAGTPAIARAMGVAAITVRRMVKDGRLRAFQSGDATSPIKVRQSEIDRVNGLVSG